MTPSRGEIWLVNLDPTVGDEIRKVRPAIIMSRDEIGTLALRVIVPITAWQDRFRNSEWLVRLEPSAENGLDKPSAADAFQVRSLAISRLVRCLGRLGVDDVQRLAVALRVVLEI